MAEQRVRLRHETFPTREEAEAVVETVRAAGGDGTVEEDAEYPIHDHLPSHVDGYRAYLAEPIDKPTTAAGSLGAARCIIEVTAGIIPGTPMERYSRRFGLSSAEWQRFDRPGVENDTDEALEIVLAQGGLLAERVGQALGYASMLMASPRLVNWVRVDWIWL